MTPRGPSGPRGSDKLLRAKVSLQRCLLTCMQCVQTSPSAFGVFYFRGRLSTIPPPQKTMHKLQKAQSRPDPAKKKPTSQKCNSEIAPSLSGPLNRLNAILSLLQPLDRYRTPLCDRECDWETPISPYLASKHRWESSTALF